MNVTLQYVNSDDEKRRSWRTALRRPVAIFLAKCQHIKKALVYEHLEEKQRNNPVVPLQKIVLVLKRERRRKRGQKRLKLIL